MRQKGFAPIIILIVIGAVLVFGAYIAGNKGLLNKLPKISVSLPSPTPSYTPVPTPDLTANWKTYTNEKYGFSFEYPGEWGVKFIENDSLSIDEKDLKERNLKITNGQYSIEFNWTFAGYGGVICKFNDTTSDNFAGPGEDKLYKPYSLKTFLGGDSRRNLDPILQLDQYGYAKNELAYTFRVCTKMNNPGSDGKPAYQGSISTKLGTLEITYTTPRSNINKDNLSMLDQILSTFKFTN